GEAGRSGGARTRSRRKRITAQPRKRGSCSGRQSGADEPAPDAVANGRTERGQHIGTGRARRLPAIEERQGRCAWIHYARGRGNLINAGGDESFRPHLAANRLKPTRL